MADPTTPSCCSTVDPNSGYCPATKTYRSLRPPAPLPPPSQPLSISHYALSLLPSSSSSSSSTFLVNASSGHRLSYPDFLRRVRSLALSLQSRFSLSKGDVAFILAPPSLHIPVLYFSLLSIGVVVSPANPLGSPSEIAHQVSLCRPAIAFSTSQIAPKLPPVPRGTVLIDSLEFESMLTQYSSSGDVPVAETMPPNRVEQSDSAAILFSSGTTESQRSPGDSPESDCAARGSLSHAAGASRARAPPRVPLHTASVPRVRVLRAGQSIRARGDGGSDGEV